jgi:hypothetical protein
MLEAVNHVVVEMSHFIMLFPLLIPSIIPTSRGNCLGDRWLLCLRRVEDPRMLEPREKRASSFAGVAPVQ